jgi:peptidoglycan/LPS O-acetylase OafA/YrhL
VRRIKFLDGLRGWGAVFVVFYHVFSEGLPVDAAFADRLTYLVPFNGMLAVFVFFVVSGFSLSVRYLIDGDVRPWLRIAVGRYVRLAIPVFAACLLVQMAIIVGCFDPPDERLEKFNRILNFDPTIGHFLKFSLVDVFFNYRVLDTYIGPLWTMSIELAGSFIALTAALAARLLPGRSLFLWGLACLIVLLAPTDWSAMLALFPLGAALADWFNRGWIDAIPRPVAFVLLAIGCSVPALLPYAVVTWGIIATPSLILGCIAVPRIRKLLNGRLAAELGRISFPLYLVHGPVMGILGEPLTRIMGNSMLLRFGIDLLVIGVSIGAAYLFAPVNNFANQVSSLVGKYVVSDNPIRHNLNTEIPIKKKP